MDGLRINPQLGLLETLEAGQLLVRKLDTHTNNLANIDTPGYKKSELSFREVLMRKIGPRYRRAFKETLPYIGMEQGELELTGEALHLAIVGEGFFKVQTPKGVAYTRSGNFTLDAQRRLVTPQGYPVLANGAPLVIDPAMSREGLLTMENLRLQVSPEGILSIDGTEVGRLEVVTFDDLNKLKKVGENLFMAEEAQERPATNYEVKQGFIEKSNVNPIKEMVNLIEIHRSFEAVQRLIRGWDEATEKLLETTRR
ncbi:MAG: flagellar basal-body rod protein FlgF [Thermodesulfobacteriaceae bacterium]|nr:flagellar basal-body rod protein FlgF [Thermodesulfobacteriaceae bacterium]MDW8135441.1 flagellar basal-body rod protein FlgF [Thermodesulfobacterium sp.]